MKLISTSNYYEKGFSSEWIQPFLFWKQLVISSVSQKLENHPFLQNKTQIPFLKTLLFVRSFFYEFYLIIKFNPKKQNKFVVLKTASDFYDFGASFFRLEAIFSKTRSSQDFDWQLKCGKRVAKVS